MFDKSTSLRKIQQGFKIPPQPKIIKEINEVIQAEDFALPDVAELVSKDIGISADVLRVVNSSSNGFNRTIADITQAVCFLGVEQIKAIVGVNGLKTAYAGESGLKLERFWDETVETASLMLFINKWLGNKYPPDTLYTLGLFHDCGIAAMGYKYPDYMDVLLSANENPDVDLDAAENERYQVTHSTVGFYLAASWRLPKEICKLIRIHHDWYAISHSIPQEYRGMMAVLMLTEYMIRFIRRFEENALFDSRKDQILIWLDMSDEDFNDLKDDLSDLV